MSATSFSAGIDAYTGRTVALDRMDSNASLAFYPSPLFDHTRHLYSSFLPTSYHQSTDHPTRYQVPRKLLHPVSPSLSLSIWSRILVWRSIPSGIHPPTHPLTQEKKNQNVWIAFHLLTVSFFLRHTSLAFSVFFLVVRVLGMPVPVRVFVCVWNVLDSFCKLT